MNVTLLHHTPLNICSNAIRTCYQSFKQGDDGGEKDRALIHKVGNVFKHASTLEHLYFNFYIKGISRACLQELARHRIASLSVKSSRYTLKELKKCESFLPNNEANLARASEFIVLIGNDLVDSTSLVALENLRILLCEGVKNDYAKYCMPECYKTELAWSINARSLQNFLELRSNARALWEMQDLAKAIFEVLPSEFKFLFEDKINLTSDA